MAEPLGGLLQIDPEQLKQFLAQFGPTKEDDKKAFYDGLSAAGFAMMGGRKGDEFGTIGRAGLLGMQAKQQSLEDSRRTKLLGIESATRAMSLQDQMRQMAEADQARKIAVNYSGGALAGSQGPAPNIAMRPPDTGGAMSMQPAAPMSPPYAAQSQAPQPSGAGISKRAMSEYYAGLARQYQAAGLVKQAEQANEMAIKSLPAVKETKTLTQNGKRVTVNIYNDGSMEVAPYSPDAEKLHFADTGNMVSVGMDPFSGGQVTGGLPKQMDPAQVAANQNALAHLQIARNADKRAAENQNKPTYDSATGQIIYLPTNGQPARAENVEGLVKPVKQAPEAYSTQLVGLANTHTAIQNYLGKMQGWTNWDALSANSQAQITTAYNNAILQLKEAMKLGVLNGGDEKILRGVLTDPLTLKGMGVSNKTIQDQGANVMGVMRRNAKNLARVYKQPEEDVDRILNAAAPPSASDIRSAADKIISGQ